MLATTPLAKAFRSAKLALVIALLGCAGKPGFGQDLLKRMPGYDRYERIRRESTNAIISGALVVTWKPDGKSFEYQFRGKHYHFDVASLQTSERNPASSNSSNLTSSNQAARAAISRSTNRPASAGRARQYASATSPDGKLKAFYRDRNVWLVATNSTNEMAITTDGSEQTRVKCGAANWVYGEELGQNSAMWWSSNSQKLAFYRFDESQVPDYYLALNQTKLQSTPNVEAYPKTGGTNPMVELLIYDIAAKTTLRVEVRDGKPFNNEVVGHYLYGVSWTSDSKELLFHRTNRRQNILEFCAANAATGRCRVIIHEEWPASWVENSPPLHFLQDGHRFLWISERTGWRNLYLYDLSGELLATVTAHPFEVANLVRVDETNRLVYYMAHSGDNPMKLQLHRVGLDGQSDQRLTDPHYHHAIDLAPDARHFMDVFQTHDQPPATALCDSEGRQLKVLASSDVTKFKKLGLKPVELLQFKATDGRTDLYGMLHFPSNFAAYRKYPLLVGVYAGPATTGAHETFTLPNALTEFGFLYASFDSRSASGRGKRFLDALYREFGRVEIDDQAAGVRSLWPRRYLDRRRVGIFGTSYGGFASSMCLLRYPDVFAAAASSSPVTDFRNYDTIYTERYMGLPQENTAAYDAASLITYANNLKGRLLLYYGTADDNVHPSNMMQFIQALQKAGKSFEVQVGPDLGHSTVNRERMMEFFIRSLVLN